MNVAFIVGCARSGTSILGELIASHPDVEYVFEEHALWERAGKGPNESHRLTARDASPVVRAELREAFGARASGSLVVDKNPRNVLRTPFVRTVFPEGKIVHIVRDGRDVACSMVPGCGGDKWRHLKPPSWNDLRHRYTGAVRCALVWKEVLEIALSDLANVPHLQVRYEDLVERPAVTAETVFRFLGLDAHPNVTAFFPRIANSTRGSYHALHQVRWYRDDHRVRIGRWRENLSEDEQEMIVRALDPLLTRLGYGAGTG